MSALLEVTGLTVRHRGNAIVDGVDLTLAPGEALGLAGESGCGKSTTALSLMRLLPPALVQEGAIALRPPGEEEPINIDRRTERGMQLVRWRHVSLVFQGAMNSLDPVQRVERQIALGDPAARAAARKPGDVKARVAELLGTVGLPARVARAYAHQLSGGQRQRVMIALALACRPSLVIADEPTTALDVVMQAQILELLERLRAELGLALILISHDLSVLAETCDRIAVMYAGRIVETGPVDAGLLVAPAPLHEAPARVAAGDRRQPRARRPRSRAARPTPPTRPRAARSGPRCPYAAGALRAGAGAARGRSGAVGRLPLRSLGALARARRRGRRSRADGRAADAGRRPLRALPDPRRRRAGARRRLARVAARRDPRHRGGVGLRQVHARARDARARPRGGGRRSPPTAPRSTAAPPCGRCAATSR